jgi:hypothetical protein
MASGSQEDTQPQKRLVTEHWSGINPVLRAAREKGEGNDKDEGGEQDEGKHEDVASHNARNVSRTKVRMVTDPTTSKEIGVEDQDETSMDAAMDPKVPIIFACHTRIID